jgi:hypothetical protein
MKKFNEREAAARRDAKALFAKDSKLLSICAALAGAPEEEGRSILSVAVQNAGLELEDLSLQIHGASDLSEEGCRLLGNRVWVLAQRLNALTDLDDLFWHARQTTETWEVAENKDAESAGDEAAQ